MLVAKPIDVHVAIYSVYSYINIMHDCTLSFMLKIMLACIIYSSLWEELKIVAYIGLKAHGINYIHQGKEVTPARFNHNF